MMDRSSGEEFIKEFERIVAAICPLNYCTYQFKLLEQLLPTENYPACRKTYIDSIKKQIGEDVIYDCEHGWHLKPSVICAACFQV